MSELTERLRAGTGGGSHWMELHREAADALEAQEARIKALGAIVQRLAEGERSDDGHTALRAAL